MKQIIADRIEAARQLIAARKSAMTSKQAVTDILAALVQEVRSLPDVYRTVEPDDKKYIPWGMENKVRPVGNRWANPEYLVSINCHPNRDGTYQLFQHNTHVADVEYMMLGNVEFVSIKGQLRGIGKICLRGGMGTTAERTEKGHGLHVLLLASRATETTPRYEVMTAPKLVQNGCRVDGAMCVAWCSRGIYAAYTH